MTVSTTDELIVEYAFLCYDVDVADDLKALLSCEKGNYKTKELYVQSNSNSTVDQATC